MTDELRAQVSEHWKRLHKWFGLRRDNIHDLAKYREWHDDDGNVDHLSEDGVIISKTIKWDQD